LFLNIALGAERSCPVENETITQEQAVEIAEWLGFDRICNTHIIDGRDVPFWQPPYQTDWPAQSVLIPSLVFL